MSVDSKAMMRWLAQGMLRFIVACAPSLAQNLELPTPTSSTLASARDMLARGESWEAIRWLRRQPTSPETRLWLGLAYFMAQQHRLFEKEMAAAAESFSTSPFPPYALGRYTLDVLQQVERARLLFEESLRRSPSYAPALYHLGWCHELAQELDRAAALYQSAEGYWLAHVGLARVALAQGDLDTARRQAQRAIAVRPEEAMAHLVFGRVLERAGEHGEALEEFERAAGLDPTDSKALYRAMQCARRLNQPERVKELLERYRKVVAIYGPAH